MPSHFASLVTAALKLTVNEREAFVQLLIDSLEGEADVDGVLAAEVDRRNAEVESGKTEVISIDDALTLVRARFK